LKQNKWNGKSRGGSLGNWFFVVTLKYLGVRAAYTLLAFVAPYFVVFAPKARKAIWFYNREILGYSRFKSLVKLFVHFYTFGQAIIDKIALKYGISDYYSFDYGNYSEFLNVLDTGTGCIIIGAHVGSWEVGTPYFREYGKNINIVMLDAEYNKIKNIIENGAEQRDHKIIPLGNDGLESILKIKKALDNKEYVCLQGDRYMDDSNSEEVLFMGRRARFPRGLFVMCQKLKVPVVFYYAMRERRGHYKFVFELADPANDIRSEYIGSLERIVRKYPQQWFNFYEFWE
jgi:predicted LPLAT superfamily acyltransferase